MHAARSCVVKRVIPSGELWSRAIHGTLIKAVPTKRSLKPFLPDSCALPQPANDRDCGWIVTPAATDKQDRIGMTRVAQPNGWILVHLGNRS